MNKRKVYVVGGNWEGQMSWIDNARLESNPEKADILLWTGGGDINPALYNQKPGKHMWNDWFSRDEHEIEMFNLAQKLGKYCFGICRGEQLLTALSGGSLVQHVHHTSGHMIYTNEGEFRGNSIHHQLANPWNMPEGTYEVLGWCLEESDVHLNGDNEEIQFPKHAYTKNGILMEPEIVWYPKTRSLGCQGHP